MCVCRWYDDDVEQAHHRLRWLHDAAGGDGAERSDVQQHCHQEAGETVLRGLKKESSSLTNTKAFKA